MTKTGVNNLSQQLCELCGIKPKLIQINPPMRAEGQEEWADAIVKKVYPDFEKPENFVRLFNLNYVQDTTICSMMTCRHKQIKNSNEFIKELVIFLQFYSGLEYTDRIKQAIAAEEWEY